MKRKTLKDATAASHVRATEHGWTEDERLAYVRWRYFPDMRHLDSSVRKTAMDDQREAKKRWWHGPVGVLGVAAKLLALPALLAALAAFWVVPPVVWAALNGESVGDAIRYVGYAQQGETGASGVFTPFDSGAFWALAIFDVLFWLIALAVVLAPLFVVSWLLDRRALARVDRDLRAKGIVPPS